MFTANFYLELKIINAAVLCEAFFTRGNLTDDIKVTKMSF